LSITNWECGIICTPDSNFPHPWDIFRKTFQFDEAQQIVKMEHGLPWMGYAHFIEVIRSRIILLLNELTLDNINKTAESIAKIGNLVHTKTVEAFIFVANVIYNYATDNSKMSEDRKKLTACAILCNKLDEFIQQNVSGESLFVNHDGQDILRPRLVKRTIRRVSSRTFQDQFLDQKVDDTVNTEGDVNKEALHMQIMRFTGELFKQKTLTGSDMYDLNIALLMIRQGMSFLLLGQEGSSRDRGIESVCVLLEGIGNSVEDKLIDQVYQGLEKTLESNNIQLEVRGRIEFVCGRWREHLSKTKDSDAYRINEPGWRT